MTNEEGGGYWIDIDLHERSRKEGTSKRSVKDAVIKISSQHDFQIKIEISYFGD